MTYVYQQYNIIGEMVNIIKWYSLAN